ncbi:hypothetical protein AURANDRAFT_67258 [Aureococcus anophagefferens]|uniref:Sulfatase N-terminal domain-containing protein n=1 Tax=Aureococcus anophagefferens TaxID=44056 RepID=F0YKJ8_AURAN|nr:hypothetical protein AURANDRAFT_67258 [Aureococcus anophagefferens]EGB04355.1 hypothetical protein AURANDRAFT_67258 [Aureococcus anophagefferens]|eukprot:XP_009040913.1 hypothetical protein AURANDRAFT_67258 [Aureococcus anophagefferens]
MNGTYSADAVRDAAVAFVRTAQRPFYAQCAFQNVHEPLEVPARFADRYAAALPARERVYAGMVSALDEAAGIVLDALPALDETVVVFFSDNGAMANSAAPSGARANYFKGGKTLTTEGGTRAPCFVRYPPLLSPGWSASLVHVVDLFPTLVALAGATHALDLDGVDAAPQLLDPATPGRRREVLYNINPRSDDADQLKAPKAALRYDDFKLSFEFWSNRSGAALYDLAADPMETSDVANRHPGVVRDLAARLEAHAARLPPPFEPWPPFQGADYACCDCEETFARGAPAVWAPWIPDDYAAAPCAPPYAACVVPPCYGH